VDHKIISTDDPRYAAEGRRFGLDAPFLRPEALSGDSVSAVDVMTHAVDKAESIYGMRFDYILLVEPTSPMRKPEDLQTLAQLLIEKGADSAVCVSQADSKFNPLKILTVTEGFLRYYEPDGQKIVARQQLQPIYVRNGIGYGVSRTCLMTKKSLITDRTLPVIIDRPVANIDEPLDLEWAEFLLNRTRQV
jgi:CMP-N-acetylneuraminic acid synthetase